MIYERLIRLLENYINNKITFEEAYYAYKEIVECNSNLNYSKINTLRRCLFSYQIVKEKGEGKSDLIVNLRQTILNFNRKIEINNDLKTKFEKIMNKVNSDLFIQIENKKIYLNVKKLNTILNDNSTDFYSVYDFHKKENENRALGDFRLNNMTGFSNYTSCCQKFIIKALENQIAGTTILATMPTGGGKSLPGQFISYYEDYGTTIVVVPTIALAIEQCNSSKRYFNGDRKARTYYEGIKFEEKREIIQELRESKIGILYLSPESIINGVFNEEILKAANIGIIKRLIIDEAHIIAEWGEFFRTEFQLLSIFRKKLIDNTKGDLKTVLLSATVTKKTEQVLRELYSEENNFIQIRGDSLRNETIYYHYDCKNETERINKLLETIYLLPRPLIIYVPVISKAKEYEEKLKELGFKRTKIFTSEQTSSERKSILEAWNEDRIDIIIATSAFGMGVDKKEVRAVVHTFIPENIDRFYQEVGRGGRDGYNALSITLTSWHEDNNYIEFFTRNKVLGVEKLIERINAMIQNPEERASGDEMWIAVETVPDRLRDDITGSLNKSWNEYVLLLLYRLKIIEIVEIKIDSNTMNRRIKIKVLRTDLINDMERMKSYIEPIRKEERENVNKDKDFIKEMMRKNKKCYGKYFKKVYEYADTKCNGCQYCRKNSIEKYFELDDFYIAEGSELIRESFCRNRQENNEIIIYDNIGKRIIQIIEILISNKIDCVILENNISLELLDLKYIRNNKMYFYDYNDLLKNNEENFIEGNIAIFMSESDKENNILYNRIVKMKSRGRIKNLIIICNKDIFIDSEGKTITNTFEGRISNLGGYNVYKR